MKNLLCFGSRFAALLAFVMLFGCEETGHKISPILGGERLLRKMQSFSGTDLKESSSSFLFVSSSNASATPSLTVSFSWKMNDGTYANSTLPFGKTHVRLDETTQTPTISFVLRFGDDRQCYTYECKDVQWLMDNEVAYAVITAKESDWPKNINLPLN